MITKRINKMNKLDEREMSKQEIIFELKEEIRELKADNLNAFGQNKVEVLKNQLHELNQLHNQLWESFKALTKKQY